MKSNNKRPNYNLNYIFMSYMEIIEYFMNKNKEEE